MVSALLENILIQTDTLIERFFRFSVGKEPVSFSRYLGDPRKILLVFSESFNEFSLGLPYIDVLLKKFPQAKISVVLAPVHACLLRGKKRVFTIPWGNRSPHSFDALFRQTAAILRREKFDLALNFSIFGRTDALLTLNSQAKIRTGLPGVVGEQYYNLLVKNIPDECSFNEKIEHVFRAIRIEPVPSNTSDPVVSLSEKDRQLAQRFIRQRQGSGKSGRIIGFVPQWSSSGSSSAKKMERMLQDLADEFARRRNPSQLLIATNLCEMLEDHDWNLASSHIYYFKDLIQMLAVMACTDKIVTNSLGVASILGSLGANVGLLGVNEEELSPLLRTQKPPGVAIIKWGNEKVFLEQALKFIT